MKSVFKTTCSLILLLMCLFTTTTIVSCNKSENSIRAVQDSVKIASLVKTVENPTLNSLDDVVSYQEKIQAKAFADSVFNNIPRDALTYIADVLIDKNGSTTPEEIIEEYKRNYKDVYRHLNKNSTSLYSSELEACPPSDMVEVPNSSSGDTIINGKYFKLIKQ